MDEIKSALEIAMEKIERLESATDEERMGWKYVPEGRGLGAKYMKRGGSLIKGLAGYEEAVKVYVMRGVAEVLIGAMRLPESDAERRTNKRAMDGLKLVRKDKTAVENVFSKMRRIFEHYAGEGEQQRAQARKQLKADMEGKLKQALTQQYGTYMGTGIDVERQPQFREEWRKIRAKLDSQYVLLLKEYKQELADIS